MNIFQRGTTGAMEKVGVTSYSSHDFYIIKEKCI